MQKSSATFTTKRRGNELIIVWRHDHRDPFVDYDTYGFIETYESYEEAKEEAEQVMKEAGKETPWYFNYKIYEEASEK